MPIAVPSDALQVLTLQIQPYFFFLFLRQSNQASCYYLSYLKQVTTAISKAIILGFSNTLFWFLFQRQNKHIDYGKEIRDKYSKPQIQNTADKHRILNSALMC